MRGFVLGVVHLRRGAGELALPRGQVGALLALLLLRPNEPFTVETLIGQLWPDRRDGDRAGARRLQVVASRLRRLLADDDPEGLAVAYDARGYRLVAGPENCDRVAFETLAAQAVEADDASLARRALGFWVGEPYTGLPVSAELHAQVEHLASVRRRLLDIATPRSVEGELARLKYRPAWPAGPVVTRALVHTLPGVGAARAIAVTAPAGYGKSTLLAQWASRQRRPVIWLSLDEDDDDPVRLWSGLVAAARAAVGPAVSERLGEAPPGSAEMIDRWGAIVDPDGAGVGLVLDDVHRVTRPDAVRQLTRLLEATPAACTVALASRRPLGSLLARHALDGSVRSVREEQLRLDKSELVELIGGDTHRAQAIAAATAGWPVATVALHRSGVALGNHDSHVIDDYIDHEVLDALPESVLDVLIEIAYLDAFNVDLCEAVTERFDVADVLEWLRAHGLFLVEAEHGAAEGWCRLHPLISATLRRRSAHRVNATKIWQRAAEWADRRGHAEQALHYAVKVGERSIVAAHARDVLIGTAVRGEAHRCVQWLAAINPEDLVGDEWAHGVGAYLAVEWMDRDARRAWLQSRHRRFPDDDPVGWLIGAIGAVREGRCTEAVELSERLLDEAPARVGAHVPELVPLLAGTTFSNLVRARALRGDVTSDDRLFPEAVGLIRPHAPLLAGWVSRYWGLVALVEGNDALAAAAAEQFYQARRPFEFARPVRRDNSVLGALVASRAAPGPPALRQLAAGIDDVPPIYANNGQYTDQAVAHLTLEHLYRRAGDLELAAPHGRQADMLLRTFPDAAFLERFREHLAGDARGAPAHAIEQLGRLTPRQRAIAELLASELTVGQIAERLFISPHTLRTHLRAIYRRLDVHSRHEAVLLVDAARGSRPASTD